MKATTWQNICIIILFSILLTACGFHLRTQEPLPPELHTLYIDSANPYGNLTLELKQILKSLDTQLVDSAQDAPITLRIFGEQYVSDVLSESASSSTEQYTLHYQVQYELLSKTGKVLFGPKIIHNQRNYTVNENQVLSTDSEQESLQTEMQHDAVFTLLRQLSAPETQKKLQQSITKKQLNS
ncbi:MAG: hypothetical protein CMF49_02380 [Legionellales bacterium]|nr:hypothetical protein [Legionellales bacterium]|tara:strand:+ start:924 stop:1472 length:549 start_codon:yes stop_codon:yes gene_type:complete